MSKFRIAVLVLLAATILYSVALYRSVQAYNEYKRKEIEESPYLTLWGDFKPFWDSSFGRPYLAGCWGLSLLWIFSLVGLIKNRGVKTQFALCLMVLTIFGVLCFLPEALATETLY